MCRITLFFCSQEHTETTPCCSYINYEIDEMCSQSNTEGHEIKFNYNETAFACKYCSGDYDCSKKHVVGIKFIQDLIKIFEQFGMEHFKTESGKVKNLLGFFDPRAMYETYDAVELYRRMGSKASMLAIRERDGGSGAAMDMKINPA